MKEKDTQSPALKAYIAADAKRQAAEAERVAIRKRKEQETADAMHRLGDEARHRQNADDEAYAAALIYTVVNNVADPIIEGIVDSLSDFSGGGGDFGGGGASESF